jgi:NHL repeat
MRPKGELVRPKYEIAMLVLKRACWRRALIACLAGAVVGGCARSMRPSADSSIVQLDARVEKVIGKRGLDEGRFQKPRAMVINAHDEVFIVDMTARIQVFDRDGNFLRSWQTPKWENGRPTGLSLDPQGNVLVADTHYHQILIYRRDGKLLNRPRLGGRYGGKPGEFGLVTDVVQDPDGNYFISEYGEFDRIQKLDSAGNFLAQWGRHGSELGEFLRPQSLALDEQRHLWVTDACNHRIQVFDTTQVPPKIVRSFGRQGTQLGELRYPYGLRLAPPNYVLVSEFGNHRIQLFTRDGKPVGVWGSGGRKNGELNAPWAIDIDKQGSVHVLDTLNHRWQRIQFRDPSLRFSM